MTAENNTGLFDQDLDSYIDTDVVSDGISGFLARPKMQGRYPGIVMIHEWWGVNDNIKEMAKILAKEQYIVFAVDLYDGKVATDSAAAGELAGSVRSNPEKAIKKMHDAVEFLRNYERVDKIGSIGWCFGGGQSLKLSLNDKLDATVIYYGTLTDDKMLLKNIRGSILGIFGDNDTTIPLNSVRSFKSALDDLGIVNQIYIYKGVGHAFANPSGRNYAEKQTIDAWQKTVKFLNSTLKGTEYAS
jgi:carboxymethylenebutenolidase